MSKARISLNKLGEYLQVNPKRRKTIVTDAKDPKVFIVKRYEAARKVARNYIVSGGDSNILQKGIENLEDKEPTSPLQEQDKLLSIESLRQLIKLKLPDLSNFTIKSFNEKNAYLEISGVDVSINPDLIIRGELKGQKVVGAIKIHISKGNQLNKEAAKNVATLLREFVEKKVAKPHEKVYLPLCLSVDVFGNVIESASKSYKQRMSNIDYACEEIALWWDNV